MNPTLNPTFKVIVYDNFHYMDESERYELGTFDSSEDALHVAKTIVDEYLASVFEPGMSSTDLFESYTNFWGGPRHFFRRTKTGQVLGMGSRQRKMRGTLPREWRGEVSRLQAPAKVRFKCYAIRCRNTRCPAILSAHALRRRMDVLSRIDEKLIGQVEIGKERQ